MAQGRETVEKLIEPIDININGDRPYDIQVHDKRFYRRVLAQGYFGLGESYMDGWWDCEALDEMIARVVRGNLEQQVGVGPKDAWNTLVSKIINVQRGKRSFKVGEQHYDVGNDLYTRMLDKRMVYTCAYWKDAETLDDAQEAKLDLVCRKIGLEPGMEVLDLGCGWGSFAEYAADKYGAHVTGLTVSREQVELGNKMCRDLPVDIRLQDYREISGTFDRVISIGLIEHVGYKNYGEYMKVVNRTLKDDGIAFIHCIGNNKSTTSANAWTNKYIFPNSMLPSIAQLSRAMEEYFVLEDLHNIGEHYDPTLMAWYKNFEEAWPDLREKYGDRFYRMWRFYLLSSAGGFRGRNIQLWQMVMTKRGRPQPKCRFS
ncbi:MAG: cyclopropane fatty acyl phospholipid synthase [Spirochaetaceae bacterium]